jgi:hypothetical protein
MSYTLTTLTADIKAYTEVDETSFNATIDSFIKNTEERILKSVQLNVFRKTAAVTITPGSKAVTFPTDFLTPISFAFTRNSAQTYLELKDHNFLLEFNPSGAEGDPRYYAVEDVASTGAQDVILAPVPTTGQTYTGTLFYNHRPTSLVDAGGSATWISTNAPTTLLYGCLLEAYTFLKGEMDMMQVYEKRFGEGLVALKQFGEAKETTDEYYVGKVSRQKQ